MVNWKDYTWLDCKLGSFEVEGMLKIQAMMTIEEKVLHSLCWNNLDFLNENHSSSESVIQKCYPYYAVAKNFQCCLRIDKYDKHRKCKDENLGLCPRPFFSCFYEKM
uniref:Uncharacterized protein n=1 Tax=Lactuca sativa TaxID=4236 RepID=A0A9R1WLX2_LACSA|nr:hypothetical protein LSAT_V11C100039150 [Lactuca sativa]